MGGGGWGALDYSDESEYRPVAGQSRNREGPEIPSPDRQDGTIPDTTTPERINMTPVEDGAQNNANRVCIDRCATYFKRNRPYSLNQGDPKTT